MITITNRIAHESVCQAYIQNVKIWLMYFLYRFLWTFYMMLNVLTHKFPHTMQTNEQCYWWLLSKVNIQNTIIWKYLLLDWLIAACGLYDTEFGSGEYPSFTTWICRYRDPLFITLWKMRQIFSMHYIAHKQLGKHSSISSAIQNIDKNWAIGQLFFFQGIFSHQMYKADVIFLQLPLFENELTAL